MESLSSLWSTVQHEVCNQTDELCQIALCAFSWIIWKADSLMVWTTAARVVSTDCLQTVVEQKPFVLGTRGAYSLGSSVYCSSDLMFIRY
jgi:hypothetical protein